MKAWETTVEDVQRILQKNTVLALNIISIESLAAQLHPRLDHDEITRAAMYGDGMDEQIEYADDCIAEQLLGMGIITINGPSEVMA